MDYYLTIKFLFNEQLFFGGAKVNLLTIIGKRGAIVSKLSNFANSGLVCSHKEMVLQKMQYLFSLFPFYFAHLSFLYSRYRNNVALRFAPLTDACAYGRVQIFSLQWLDSKNVTFAWLLGSKSCNVDAFCG